MAVVAESVIAMADASLTVTPSLSERLILLSADDGAAETVLDLPPAKVRWLILALKDALRLIED